MISDVSKSGLVRWSRSLRAGGWTLQSASGGVSMMVVPPAHFFQPEAGREHFCDVAGVCPNRLASQAQQSLLAKLKSAYRGSALGLPASASVMWLL